MSRAEGVGARFAWKQVQGPSMTPTIPTGSSVLLDLSSRSPVPSSVVAFLSWEGDSYLHRVLYAWPEQEGSVPFLERGDGDDVFTIVTADRIVGSAVAVRRGGQVTPLSPAEAGAAVSLTAVQRAALGFLARRCKAAARIPWLGALCNLVLPTLLMRLTLRFPHYSWRVLMLALKNRTRQVVRSARSQPEPVCSPGKDGLA